MRLSKWLLSLWGWKVVGHYPDYKKMVVVSAPHTSMWDFVIGRLYFYTIGVQPRLLMKKELFFFPLGYLLKQMGGIPVDRSRKTNIVEQLVDKFEVNESFVLIITPEGTRKKVKNWKEGFYHIAKAANVPIVPGYFDYDKKIIGIGNPFFVSESAEKDVNHIKNLVKDVVPKHPQKYSYT
jgi:1-acyl-sn-glycerol-3-phosphate acyltransferase